MEQKIADLAGLYDLDEAEVNLLHKVVESCGDDCDDHLHWFAESMAINRDFQPAQRAGNAR